MHFSRASAIGLVYYPAMEEDARVLVILAVVLIPVSLVAVFYRGRDSFNVGSFAREVLIVGAAYFAYFGVRGATEGNRDLALENAERVADFERAIGMFWEPNLQDLIVDRQEFVTLFNWIYIWGHWPLIGVVAIWLFINRNNTYRLIRNAFLISGGIGLVFFALFPVAPPRLAEADVVDTVTRYSNSYRVLQPQALTNQYAAFPSLHFGWNLLIGLTLAVQARQWWAKAIGIVTPILMVMAVVLTANHYIIDAVGGAALALFGLFLAYRLRRAQKRFCTRSAVPAQYPNVSALPLTADRPLTIAHRAGNDIATLREAEVIGVDLVEADIWRYRGRVEVRHFKTMGPIPLLWDRWALAPGWTRRFQLEELLRGLRPGVGLMLDLKGTDPDLPPSVIDLLARYGGSRPIAVCSQNWELVRPFLQLPGVIVVHSVGNERQLRTLLGISGSDGRHAISIHQRLLTPEVVRLLKGRAGIVVTWPINDDARVRELAAWGVDGVISDDLEVLRRVVAARTYSPHKGMAHEGTLRPGPELR